MSLSIFNNIALDVPKRKAPNFVREVLERKSSYFVVKVEDEFHYYKVLIEPVVENHPLMRLSKSPPILEEGIFIFEKRLYQVTIPDLLRGVIRKSREIIQEKRTTRKNAQLIELPTSSTSGTSDPENIVISTAGETIQSGIQPTTGRDTELQILQQANLHIEEQIGALLNPYNTEEGEWEITDIAEPGPNNEVSTVQDS